MLRVFGDFESFYDNDYSLRKMTPIEYVLDPRWETLGCAIGVEHGKTRLFPQDEVADYLRGISEPYCFISHNALFDALILALRYNIHPAGLIDTLGMCRALLAHETPGGRSSLAVVAKHLGYEPKGEFIHRMRGVHAIDLFAWPALVEQWEEYTLHDLDLCRKVFFNLAPRFPPGEALIMDRVIRMTTQPRLVADVAGLNTYHAEVVEAKYQLLARVGLTERSKLMSDNQFAELLREQGVDPPTKYSVTQNKQVYAFAKTDTDFRALEEDDNPEVQALVAARIGNKTTIEENRSKRFIAIAQATDAHYGEPLMPIPLKYGGAHTHRLSGDWKLNFQNLGARKTKRLRQCLLSRVGRSILAVDAAQIEARLTAWICGQNDLVEQFANNEDVYSNFASLLYGRTISKRDVVERFNGKTCILGLGFRMGPDKLLISARHGAREFGIPATYTFEQCLEWVQTYRRKMDQIQKTWYWLDDVIKYMAQERADGFQIGPCHIMGCTVVLPSGLSLFYDNLHLNEQRDYVYSYGGVYRKLHGGILLENIVQALDRQHTLEAAIRTEKRAAKLSSDGLRIDGRIVLNVHDENVHEERDEVIQQLAEIAQEEMCRCSWWAEGLPLAAETKVGKNFGEME
jgi:hypothetical protein